jgi:hypothetical protein
MSAFDKRRSLFRSITVRRPSALTLWLLNQPAAGPRCLSTQLGRLEFAPALLDRQAAVAPFWKHLSSFHETRETKEGTPWRAWHSARPAEQRYLPKRSISGQPSAEWLLLARVYQVGRVTGVLSSSVGRAGERVVRRWLADLRSAVVRSLSLYIPTALGFPRPATLLQLTASWRGLHS